MNDSCSMQIGFPLFSYQVRISRNNHPRDLNNLFIEAPLCSCSDNVICLKKSRQIGFSLHTYSLSFSSFSSQKLLNGRCVIWPNCQLVVVSLSVKLGLPSSEVSVTSISEGIHFKEVALRDLQEIVSKNFNELITVSALLKPRGSIFQNWFLVGVLLIFDLPGVVIKTGLS